MLNSFTVNEIAVPGGRRVDVSNEAIKAGRSSDVEICRMLRRWRTLTTEKHLAINDDTFNAPELTNINLEGRYVIPKDI